MDVKDLALNETLSNRFNNSFFPRSIRGLIVGKSASGGQNNFAFKLFIETWVVRL